MDTENQLKGENVMYDALIIIVALVIVFFIFKEIVSLLKTIISGFFSLFNRK
jgi:uncharacterized protein HemY